MWPVNRNFGVRFGITITLVNSLWQESLVVSLGILSTDDCRPILSQTQQNSWKQTVHQVRYSNLHRGFYKVFHQRIRIHHNNPDNDDNTLYLFCNT